MESKIKVYDEVYIMLNNRMRIGHIHAIHYIATKNIDGKDTVAVMYDVALKEDPDYIEENAEIYLSMEELWNGLVFEYNGNYYA
jgi:hypothetical protein